MTEITGPFFGNGLTYFPCEEIAHAYFSPARKKIEAGLMATVWYDYRFVHPVVRAHLYWHEFNRAHGRCWQRHFDSSANPLRFHAHRIRNLFHLRRKQIDLHLGLQAKIDELGVPYPFFFDAAHDYLLQEAGFSNWKKETTIIDMEGEERVIRLRERVPGVKDMIKGDVFMAVQARFDRRFQRGSFLWSTLPYYSNRLYQGEPWQCEHRAFLCGHLSKRGHDMPRIASELIEADVLHERDILRHMGPEAVRRVRKAMAC